MNTEIKGGPEGEYYLRGIPEMASGFKLDKDKSFRFFLIYGALDRYGSGTWKTEGAEVIFQSKAWSGKDFALLNSKSVRDDFTTIKITDNNKNVLRYMFGSLKKGEEGSWQQADENGIILFPRQSIKTISLLFEFCPERFSVFDIGPSEDNYFEFRLEPWLVEYFFTDFRLTLTDDGLKGKHPMLEGDEYKYEKRTNKL